MVANHEAAPRFHFLDVAHRRLVHLGFGMRRHEHLRQHVLINQRNRAVLHEAARHAFGVLIGDFLHFQRGFHRGRHVDAAPQKEPVFHLGMRVGDVPNFAETIIQHPLNFFRQLLKLVLTILIRLF